MRHAANLTSRSAGQADVVTPVQISIIAEAAAKCAIHMSTAVMARAPKQATSQATKAAAVNGSRVLKDRFAVAALTVFRSVWIRPANSTVADVAITAKALATNA